jgi:dGTPase
MDPTYAHNVITIESYFADYAKKSTESSGRRYTLTDDPFRTPFERDTHRVLHSLPFRRLKHKTQVFFAPKDDHICTRIEHSLHVASISTTICKRLKLNHTLAEAIALAHDLGHPPFGHLGENALIKIHAEYNKSKNKEILRPFMHEAQSLRVIDFFKNQLHGPLNLTYEVRDGVVCHCGEKNEQTIRPDYKKDIKSVDESAARNQLPATLEGCVVRAADTISYLGRDFEDACTAKLVSKEELPLSVQKILGANNSEIIGNLINDLVFNSTNNNYLSFSDEVSAAMKEMKDFNYKKIYHRPELSEQEKRIFLILNNLFNYFLDYVSDKQKYYELLSGKYPNYQTEILGSYLRDMDIAYDENQLPRTISDFIAGMTDNFALNCFNELFTINRFV